MNLRENLIKVERRITDACDRAGRGRSDVTLVAVTKTHPAEIIRQAYDLGLRDFGENRVQELTQKFSTLNSQFSIHWHLIGQLQSKKAKYVAPFVHLVHSIDSLSTAKELSKRAEQNERIINILIEVNVAGEESKSGIAPAELDKFLDDIREQAPSVNPLGLMTVAPFEDDPERVRPHFVRLRELAQVHNLSELSMGMSNDFEVAIEEGATIVRIGSALFGDRGT